MTAICKKEYIMNPSRWIFRLVGMIGFAGLLIACGSEEAPSVSANGSGSGSGSSRGATVDEVRELSRLSQEGCHKATQEELAAGAKGLAMIKEGRIPSMERLWSARESSKAIARLRSWISDEKSNDGGRILKRGVRVSRRFVSRSDVENKVVSSSRMRIGASRVMEDIVNEMDVEIAMTGETEGGKATQTASELIDRTPFPLLQSPARMRPWMSSPHIAMRISTAWPPWWPHGKSFRKPS
jgi:hypothetical protein